ncbi:hypothetical protein, partial [Bifidobacterium pullorum]|uniref:hypothetical protein n=1 Tax=Bifidobacterium pullorum TaxID=78448 RepID=UPI0019591FAB
RPDEQQYRNRSHDADRGPSDVFGWFHSCHSFASGFGVQFFLPRFSSLPYSLRADGNEEWGRECHRRHEIDMSDLEIRT